MCGLIGAFPAGGARFLPEDVAPALERMRRRGPDASGVREDGGAVLGHRRLAILDLDPRAHQPMVSADGRLSIAYNGEIYNFRELRTRLEASGTRFRTTSDTEVLLALFAAEGESMLPRLRGMFAFAIWDSKSRRAFIARDPYGIKPLYVASTATGLLVGSQVRALMATGMVSAAPDPRGQAAFWLLGSVPEPRTWFRDVSALPAGHCAWIADGRMEAPRRWWDVAAAWRDAPPGAMKRPDVPASARAALRASVAAHLVSDVPVGVFLSGGIDSGAVAALIVEAGARALEGVTVAFREFEGREEDEAPVAARVAARYGIAHRVRVVERAEFEADLPRILEAMDQPSVDGVNTWYAAKAAAERGLKVVVSGVGGDELFQGYSSFARIPRLVRTWGALSRVPGAMTVARAAAGLKARRSGNSRWSRVPDWGRSVQGAWWLSRGLFGAEDLPGLMGEAAAAEALAGFDPRAWVDEMSGPPAPDPRLAVGQIESTTYLRNQLLRDSDWASMDHGVELRTPLVDAWLLRDLQPALAHFRGFPGKSLLSGAPAEPLPTEVTRRRKTGFGIPLGRWMSAGRSAGDQSRAWARRVAAAFEGSGAR